MKKKIILWVEDNFSMLYAMYVLVIIGGGIMIASALDAL